MVLHRQELEYPGIMRFEKFIIQLLKLIGQRELAREYARRKHDQRVQRYYARNPYL